MQSRFGQKRETWSALFSRWFEYFPTTRFLFCLWPTFQWQISGNVMMINLIYFLCVIYWQELLRKWTDAGMRRAFRRFNPVKRKWQVASPLPLLNQTKTNRRPIPSFLACRASVQQLVVVVVLPTGPFVVQLPPSLQAERSRTFSIVLQLVLYLQPAARRPITRKWQAHGTQLNLLVSAWWIQQQQPPLLNRLRPLLPFTRPFVLH